MANQKSVNLIRPEIVHSFLSTPTSNRQVMLSLFRSNSIYLFRKKIKLMSILQARVNT